MSTLQARLDAFIAKPSGIRLFPLRRTSGVVDAPRGRSRFPLGFPHVAHEIGHLVLPPEVGGGDVT